MTYHSPGPARPPMKIVVGSFPEEAEEREIGYERFTFPDGQPHIKLDEVIEQQSVDITLSITSPADLFDLMLVAEILDRGENDIHLYVRYLMGGRMDRPIDAQSPDTLRVVTSMLQAGTGYAFETTSVLDPHSEPSTGLMAAEADYPFLEVFEMLENYRPEDVVIVIPDVGAKKRVRLLTADTGFDRFVQGHKKRDSATGKLSGFSVDDIETVAGFQCIMIDDLCDGGYTFTGIAKLLREAGAIQVDLFVTHGVFSKGRNLDGIDNIYTTNSY